MTEYSFLDTSFFRSLWGEKKKFRCVVVISVNLYNPNGNDFAPPSVIKIDNKKIGEYCGINDHWRSVNRKLLSPYRRKFISCNYF